MGTVKNAFKAAVKLQKMSTFHPMWVLQRGFDSMDQHKGGHSGIKGEGRYRSAERNSHTELVRRHRLRTRNNRSWVRIPAMVRAVRIAILLLQNFTGFAIVLIKEKLRPILYGSLKHVRGLDVP